MTNEEAIKILMDGELNPCVAEDREACDMAIKALEQEDILDKIREDINHLTVYYTTKVKGTSLISQRAVNRVIDKYRK